MFICSPRITPEKTGRPLHSNKDTNCCWITGQHQTDQVDSLSHRRPKSISRIFLLESDGPACWPEKDTLDILVRLKGSFGLLDLPSEYATPSCLPSVGKQTCLCTDAAVSSPTIDPSAYQLIVPTNKTANRFFSTELIQFLIVDLLFICVLSRDWASCTSIAKQQGEQAGVYSHTRRVLDWPASGLGSAFELHESSAVLAIVAPDDQMRRMEYDWMRITEPHIRIHQPFSSVLFAVLPNRTGLLEGALNFKRAFPALLAVLFASSTASSFCLDHPAPWIACY